MPPQPGLDELRAKFGGSISDDELILRLLVPDSDIAAMRATPPRNREFPATTREMRFVRQLVETATEPAPALGEGRPTKRRAGADAGGLPVADSRPVLRDGLVIGSRCEACGYPSAQVGLPWCPACMKGQMVETGFAPQGAIWSSTVVAIRVLTRKAPFALGHLDLDDGPRVMVRLTESVVHPPGTRVEITHSEDGDLIAARPTEESVR